MSRPVITAIMLDDLRRKGTEIRLDKESIVTPAARDWLKDNAVPVSWVDSPKQAGGLAVMMDTSVPEMRAMRTMMDQQGILIDVIEPAAGQGGVMSATRRLCGSIVGRAVAKGAVFAVDGALPVCVANKHKGIRAALGVNVSMVEEACRQVGINVLVIEYPTQTTFQMKQMIDRLMNCANSVRPETLAVIGALEQGDSPCG